MDKGLVGFRDVAFARDPSIAFKAMYSGSAELYHLNAIRFAEEDGGLATDPYEDDDVSPSKLIQLNRGGAAVGGGAGKGSDNGKGPAGLGSIKEETVKDVKDALGG